jgi:hypothetical protein
MNKKNFVNHAVTIVHNGVISGNNNKEYEAEFGALFDKLQNTIHNRIYTQCQHTTIIEKDGKRLCKVCKEPC